jgi:hypothetical protein
MLAVELFNRPRDEGRVESVLILLQHSFEMLLKGAIYQTRRTIWEKGQDTSYKFEKCLSISLSDINIINEDEKRMLSILDCLRDCATHNLIDMSEDILYLHTQAAVTVFDDILFRFFSERLANHMPSRVLPISTSPPKELKVLLDDEFSQISDLLRPGRRHIADVKGRLRYHMIVESCIQGDSKQPSEREINKIIKAMRRGDSWTKLFPGVAVLGLDAEGYGLSFSVRFTRKEEAAPVRLIREYEPEAQEAILVREVNLLDRYSMGLLDLADKLRVTSNMAVAYVYHFNIREDSECYKEFRIGGTLHKRYSPKAFEILSEALIKVEPSKVWREYRNYIRSKRLNKIKIKKP